MQLTLADNGNGSGVTATISGTNAASTVTLYGQLLNESGVISDWVSHGTRTGDGTIVASVEVGAYWWYATAVLGSAEDVSGFVYQAALDVYYALHDKIIDAVFARAGLLFAANAILAEDGSSLALEDDTTILLEPGALGIRKIAIRKKPRATVDELPLLMLTTFGKSESELGGTNAMDDTGYPVYAIFLDRQPEDDKDRRWKLWRQRFRRAFREQLLPGVPEMMTCRIEPDPVVTLDGPKFALANSALLLRHLAREPRGLGV